MASNAISPETDSNVDANSLLTELDKGLRSLRIGEQCESIVRFPWLFERYPFPILINSACLKLAEVFRNGTNFLRVLILKVMQQSEKHLDKIVNVDEFVRRLHSVTFSNDPLARAITLRAFASIAHVVAQRKSLHHYIRKSLDATDELESDAAIEATVCFASKCNEFASNIYPKVVSMINSVNTSIETKINLLSVLHHVNYNTSVAFAVREHCVQFLPIYEKHKKFVCASLHTLTIIASTSLTQIPNQIDLLMHHLANDNRINVKASVLRDLKFLAFSSPHLWQKENINTLVDTALREDFDNNLLHILLSVLTTLVDSPCIAAGQTESFYEIHTKIVHFCLHIVYHEHNNIELIAVSISILTNLSLNTENREIMSIDVIQETCCAIHAFLMLSINDDTENANASSLNKIFKCIVSLCQSSLSTATEPVIEVLRFVIMNAPLNSLWFGFACQSLCAINSTTLSHYDLLSLIKQSLNYSDDCEVNLVQLFTLYFQESVSTKMTDSIANDLLLCLENRSLWCCFKIVRQSMRYGHHLIGSILLKRLRNTRSSENIHFWLISLSCISNAESHLIRNENIEDIDKSLNMTISEYIEGLVNLKASVSSTNPMKFQCEYVKLRLKFLQTHQLFNQCCKLIRTSPPPAIAASAALNTRDDILKCGNIVIMMRKCAKEFRFLSESYSSLYQSSFNADSNTLFHIQLLQHSCVILAEAIESLFQNNRINALFVSKDIPFQNTNVYDFQTSLEHKCLIEICAKISKIVHIDLVNMQTQQIKDSIGGKHINLLESLSSEVLNVPLYIPRFFFQTIQNTCIKLAISPQPKSHGDLLIINNNINFALRIEGVIVNHGDSVIRKVKKILLCLNAIFISRPSNSQTNNDMNIKSSHNDSNLSLQSVVIPHNDYFQSQFLLTLVNTGLYTINVETSIIDENEAQWKSGPHLTLSAKVVEDSSLTCK